MVTFTVVAPTIDKGAVSCVFDNIDLIIANRDKILSHSEYKNIKVKGFFVSGLYVGSHELSVGDMLNLWQDTVWHTGTRYYFNIIGSPLSGKNQAFWYDYDTKRINSGTYFDGRVGFTGLAKPYFAYMKKRREIRKYSNLNVFDLVQKLRS